MTDTSLVEMVLGGSAPREAISSVGGAGVMVDEDGDKDKDSGGISLTMGVRRHGISDDKGDTSGVPSEICITVVIFFFELVVHGRELVAILARRSKRVCFSGGRSFSSDSITLCEYPFRQRSHLVEPRVQ
jgi:hypothetical protein